MSSKRLRFSSLSLLTALMLSPKAEAGIPITAFKGVTRYFKEDEKYNSPTYAEAFLLIGGPYNFRLYGNIERGQEGLHIKDKGLDALARLTINLFPSPSGALNVETTTADNFGKYATPASVAELLNFAHKVGTGRKFTTAEISELSKRIQETFDQKLLAQIKEDPRKEKEREVREKAFQAAIRVLERKAKKTESKVLSASTAEEKTQREKEFQDAQRALRTTEEKAKKSADTASEERKRKQKELKTLQTRINGIFNSIQEAIINEKNGLYPVHTTQQIINTFFCEKFSNQGDIWALVRALQDMKSDIIDPSAPLIDLKAQKIDLLTQEELDGIAKKIREGNYDADDLFALLNADVFFQRTPYKPGNLISNGNTRPYNRHQGGDDYDYAAGTYADCGEMAARHVMNLLLYNPETKQFDLSHLKKHIKEDNPYFKLFEEFYTKQTPGQANDGNIDMRSLWAKVLGDLNADGGPIQISYLKKRSTQDKEGNRYEYEYELNPGYINFVKVFYKIFGLELQALPTTGGLEAQKDWLEKSLQNLFSIINPTRSYEFDLSTVTQTGNDLSGNIQIRAKDPAIEAKPFSFKFYAKVREHSELRDLLVPHSAGEVDYSHELKDHLKAISQQQQETAEDALWLLKPNLAQSLSLFYSLLSERLSDNDSRIRVLNKVSESYQKIIANPALKTILPQMLKNILADINWEDPAVLKNASPVVAQLMKIEELQPLVSSGVKGFYLSSGDEFKNPHLQPLLSQVTNLIGGKSVKSIEGIRVCNALKHLDLTNAALENLIGLDTLTNLESLKLAGLKSLEDKDLDVTNFSKLKNLNLNNSVIKKLIGLNTLTRLENLNLRSTNLKELDVTNLSQLSSLDLSNAKLLKDKNLDVTNLRQLKSLTLTNTNIEKLTGLNSLTNLESLGLSITRWFKDKDLDVTNLNQLKSLDLSSSSIEHLTGLNTLTSLESFVLRKVRWSKDKDLDVTNLSQLKNLDLNSSSIKKLTGLNTLATLQSLNLENVNSFENKVLDVSNLSHLKRLNLSDSNFEELTGLNNLTSLTDLALNNMKSLKKDLDLTNLSELDWLDLSSSSIENLTGLNNLNRLKTLNLNDTISLGSLDVTGLSQLVTLDLESSSIPKLSGLHTLTHLQRLSLKSSAIQTLSGFNNLPDLLEVDLGYSAVKELLVGSLPSLNSLVLAGTTSLKSLEFTTDMKHLYIDLTGSNLTKAHIKGLEYLDERKILGG